MSFCYAVYLLLYKNRLKYGLGSREPLSSQPLRQHLPAPISCSSVTLP